MGINKPVSLDGQNISVDLTSVNSKLETIQTDINGLKTDVSTVKADVTALENTVDNVNTNITAVKTDLATVDGIVDNINSNVTTVKSNVSTIKTTANTIKSATVQKTLKKYTGTVSLAKQKQTEMFNLSTAGKLLYLKLYVTDDFTMSGSSDLIIDGVSVPLFPNVSITSSNPVFLYRNAVNFGFTNAGMDTDTGAMFEYKTLSLKLYNSAYSDRSISYEVVVYE